MFIYTEHCGECRSDDLTKKKKKKTPFFFFFFFFAFKHFEFYVLVEHDEKHPQPKLSGNLLMEARDMVAFYGILGKIVRK